MNLPGYYSSGQFARLADVSVRTIRFYDKQNILKPSLVTESGARFYSDEDLARLQQILLLKDLGFSLEDIRLMTVGEQDAEHLLRSLHLQQKLVQDRIAQLQNVEAAIGDTAQQLREQGAIDWSAMRRLIRLSGMEKSLASQYRSASNLSARIRLHSLYSVNRTGWFPWIFDQLGLRSGMDVLELGCGDGALWSQNREKVPDGARITLTDISEGMVRDVQRAVAGEAFRFQTADAAALPFEAGSFDLVIANHVLFYCEDIPQVLSEVRRVLRPGGRFVCSTYGAAHMAEITQLVQSFDAHIVLSDGVLYDRFGLENGFSLLKPVFPSVRRELYRDELIVDEPEPLIEYILSCHGNQNSYIPERYREFRAFVQQRTKKGLHITKAAGLFVCEVQETAAENDRPAADE